MSCTIGLMSGTSFDGVDGVIFDTQTKRVHTHFFEPYDNGLKKLCHERGSLTRHTFEQLAELTSKVTHCYERVIEALLGESNQRHKISIIGVHGQTIKHSPKGEYPFSYQLINASYLATRFLLPVACDFRSNDIFLGGQGAPLAPIFHQYLFNLTKQTVVVNLGGIANITYLDERSRLCGFDTGPANALLDAWILKEKGCAFDDKGQWAAQGKLIPLLLSELMTHPFIKLPAPKSADKNAFSLDFLQPFILGKNYAAKDIQKTLMMFTTQTLMNEINQAVPDCHTLIVCGGGAHNEHLMQLLYKKYKQVKACEDLGYSSTHIEAMLIAWLADRRQKEEKINLTTVTGASRATCLGAVYCP